MQNNITPDKQRLTSGKLYKIFLRFVKYLSKEKIKVGLNIIVMSAMIATGASIIWVVGNGVNSLSNGESGETGVYLFSFCLLVMLLQLLRYLNHYFHEALQQQMIYQIRHAVYHQLLRLSVPYINKTPTGDLLARLGQDIYFISQLIVLSPAQLYVFLLSGLIYLSILFYIDSFLTLCTLLMVPCILFHQHWFLGRARLTAREFLSCQGNMSSFEEDTLNNIQGVVSLSAEPQMLRQFDSNFMKFKKSAMNNLMLNNAFVVTFELIIALAAVALVAVGVYRVNTGYLNMGELVKFLLYLGYLAVPIRGIVALPVESQIRASAAERIMAILDEWPSVKDQAKKITAVPTNGQIELRHISFGYSKSKKVLKDISIKIGSGEFVAIVGPSGAGKSTLAKLLLRFYEPDAGSILIDDIDIRNISLQTLRSSFAVVWQSPFLIDGSILDNLRLSNPDASDIEIMQAIKDANAKDFIDKLEQGLNTRSGSQSASSLSVGQKQRLALAQALLRHAPVLILDEATSALDSLAEVEIQKTLNRLHHRSTLLVIAHRYSTIANADRVIYLNDDGSVVVGTPRELANECEPFRQVLSHQQKTVL